MKSNIKQSRETAHWPTRGSILFASQPGDTLPYIFAKNVLCQNNHDRSLWEAESHPDVKMIRSEENRVIRIDQIRSLNEWAQEKPSISTCKVALIDPADMLNIQAANALLKTLEEPHKDLLFILITSYPERLLSTLRSRCHIIRHRIEATSQMIDQELIDNVSALEKGILSPLKLAEIWNKKDVGQTLHGMLVYLNEFLKKTMLCRNNIDYRAWWKLYDIALQAKQAIDDKTPVNTLLLLESLLIHYESVMKGRT